MSVEYTIVSKKSVIGGQPKVKYYAQLTNRKQVDLRGMCNLISKRSTLTSSDIYGVLEALIDELTHQLQNGKNVKLDDLGIFSLYASAHGREQAAEVSARDIHKVKVGFRASPWIKRNLQSTDFEKVEK